MVEDTCLGAQKGDPLRTGDSAQAKGGVCVTRVKKLLQIGVWQGRKVVQECDFFQRTANDTLLLACRKLKVNGREVKLERKTPSSSQVFLLLNATLD